MLSPERRFCGDGSGIFTVDLWLRLFRFVGGVTHDGRGEGVEIARTLA
jgi:hypothetical protein